MATFNEAILGWYTIREGWSIRMNMRRNAETHKVQIAAGQPVAAVAADMNAAALRYIARVDQIRNYVDDPLRPDRLAMVLAGLEAYSVTEATARAEFAAVRSVAVQLRDANKNTANQITNVCNGLLAALPSMDLPSGLL